MTIVGSKPQRAGAKLTFVALLALAGPAGAADPEAPAELNVVLSQRFWHASWDQAVTDVTFSGETGPTGLPLARAVYQKNVSRRTVPITALGLRYGRWTATVSRFSTQRFDGHGVYSDPAVSRDETDLSIGYQALPGLSLALIRKTGRVSSNQTRGTTELFGSDTPIDGRATLAGLSASAPINDRLVLYGNAAYGPGTFRDPNGGFEPIKSRYTVSEFGLAYRHALGASLAGLQAFSIQAGYRVQSISYTGIATSDFEGLPIEVNVSASKARSVTDGFILSLSLIF